MSRGHCLSPSASGALHEAMPPPPPPGVQQVSPSSCLSPPAWSPPPRQPTTQRLCVLAAGVLIFHVLTSTLQEMIFHLPNFTNLLLLSCGETFCTTVLVGLLLVWDWYHPLPGRAAPEHRGPHGRSAATAVTKITAEVTPQEPLSKSAPTVGDSSNTQGRSSGNAVSRSPDPFCDSEHQPPRQRCPFARGDGRGAFLSVVDGLPEAAAARADAVDCGNGSALTAVAARCPSPTRFASWYSTICHVLHPSTVSLRWYVCIAILFSCSLHLTNRTSFLLNYPLQVIFKSSKLLCMVVVHRFWVHDSHEAAASVSEDEAGSDNDDPRSSGHQWSTTAASAQHDGVFHAESDSGLLAGAKAPDASERHPRDEPQHRGHRDSSSSSPPLGLSTVVAVNVPIPAGRAFASSHPLDDDQQRSRWGALHSSGPRRRSWRWWWSRLWNQHCNDGVSRWCPARVWARVSSLAQCCASRPTTLPIDEWGHSQAVVGLRQRLSYHGGVYGGYSAVEVWCAAAARLVWWLQRLLRDTEMMACIAIVVGLISFTYASHLDMHVAAGHQSSKEGLAALAKAVSAEAAAEQHILAERLRGNAAASLAGSYSVASDVAAPVNTTGLAQPGAPLPLPPPSLPASSPSSLFHSITAAVFRLSAPWMVTLIGVVGVLMSNTLDCIIYVLEEVHCFHATARSSRGYNRRVLRQHERAAGGRAPLLAGVQRRAAPLQHHASHRPPFSPSPPLSSSPPRTAVTAPSDLHPVSPTSMTELPELIPASPQELLFMVNGIATLLYIGGVIALWLHDCLLLFICRFTSSNAVATATGLHGGVGDFVSATAAGQPAARERLVVPTRPAGGAALPGECSSLMDREEQQLQRLASLSGWPPWKTPSAPQRPSATDFPLSLCIILIVLASLTSLIGTLCLLRIIAEFTGVMAVVVTSVRKALTVLLSFLLYHRRFTLLHGVGLVGVVGGAVWYELQQRRRRGV
ncbi:conserved hypothetical protein [Leishmania braziliensis MHOM/BR/75/M2904]|uniref:Uncharacterized protein n=2 Tax=Leishmania braziliensis TaxID=5660 RepID=A4H3D0_LEIBR|nr:conserved hypothetical protein [Leishmania braziliensis MHOM/BR/75/M2904]CAJ2465770.1 unnamed protein product [Leishmania braziliensis]CAM41436.2 conserved hypothetical protein [Leishmania braziliensis MHOM/BR/75/M2904]